jgi:octaprenyl-diphosphate synthase
LIVECGNAELSGYVLKTAEVMCKGQLIQIMKRGDFFMSEAKYLEIVSAKTASLFELAAAIGIMASGGLNNEVLSIAKNYGAAVGMAYQMIDDLADILGEEGSGKFPGQDIKSGDPTLPLIYLAKYSAETPLDGQLWAGSEKKNKRNKVKEIIISRGIDEQVIRLADSYVKRAVGCAGKIKDPVTRKSLIAIAEAITQSSSCLEVIPKPFVNENGCTNHGRRSQAKMFLP